MTEAIRKVIALEKSEYGTQNLYELYVNGKKYYSSEDKIAIAKREFLEQHFISLDDVFGICSYTSQAGNNFCSRIVNNSIRYNSQSEIHHLLINLIDEALLNLTSYNNMTVYRMVNVTYFDDFQSQIDFFDSNIGNVFIVNHFLSTSRANWKNRMTWKIKTLSLKSLASDIEYLSALNLNSELEVLFPRKSKFKIVGIEIENNYYQINLEEVSSPTLPFLTFRSQLEHI